MRAYTQRVIGLIIMGIGIVIGGFSLLMAENELYDLSTLIFLIGIIINYWGMYRLLNRYEKIYGKIEK